MKTISTRTCLRLIFIVTFTAITAVKRYNVMSQQLAAIQLGYTTSALVSTQSNGTTRTILRDNASRSTYLRTEKNPTANVSTGTTTKSSRNETGVINFLHIGKNGGYTIEQIGKKNKNKCGVWGSQMVQEMPKPHNGWTTSQFTLPKEANATRIAAAYEWHAPPAGLTEDRRDRMYPHAQTFCTIRHPFARLVSAYYYQHLVPTAVGPLLTDPRTNTTKRSRRYVKGPCFDDSPEHASEIILKTLQTVKTDPCTQSCHYLPQKYFLEQFPGTGYRPYPENYDPTGSTTNPLKQCDRIIVLDVNLTEQFNDLMKDIQCPIRMEEIPKNNAHSKTCGADPNLYERGKDNPYFRKKYNQVKFEELSEEVRELARQVYADDLTLYEYYANQVKVKLRTKEKKGETEEAAKQQ